MKKKNSQRFSLKKNEKEKKEKNGIQETVCIRKYSHSRRHAEVATVVELIWRNIVAAARRNNIVTYRIM